MMRKLHVFQVYRILTEWSVKKKKKREAILQLKKKKMKFY